jgi:Protein kinase domain
MSSVRVQCPNPNCQASFSVAPGEAPRFRRCPQCGSELSGLDDPDPVVSPATPPAWGQPPRPFDLVEGSVFAGRYTIVRQLGRGGMGAVYLAEDHELGRPVALKVPLITGDAPEFLSRFRREARSAARLHHPNICPVYDVGEHNGQPYLTMAYIDGISLADFLRRRGAPLEPDKAARLSR